MDNKDFDIIQEWQRLSQQKFSNSKTNKIDIMNAINQESNSTIQMLKSRLKTKVNWIIFFISALSIWMVFSIGKAELLIILGMANLIYIIAFVLMWPQYRKMDSTIDFSDNTLDHMKKNYQLLKTALHYERLFGLFTFPISLIIGALIANQYKGVSILESFQNERLVLMLMVLLIVLVPLMYILSERMNKCAFEPLKSKLEKNIIRLEMLQ